jgi:enamine deaminase RidA (YjgF/YER057c/UK114 family)
MTTTMSPEARLEQRGLTLRAPGPAVGTYVGVVRVGELVFVSGHGPLQDGEYIFKGKLGRELDVAQGKQAAELVASSLPKRRTREEERRTGLEPATSSLGSSRSTN